MALRRQGSACDAEFAGVPAPRCRLTFARGLVVEAVGFSRPFLLVRVVEGRRKDNKAEFEK